MITVCFDAGHGRLAILEGATRSEPGCLAEFGFITNSGDMAAIFGEGSRDRRIACFRSIFAGILEAGK